MAAVINQMMRRRRVLEPLKTFKALKNILSETLTEIQDIDSTKIKL